MRKILAIILAVCTVLSMLVAVPITATADSTAPATVGYQEPEVTVTTEEAEAEGSGYTNMEDVTTVTAGSSYFIDSPAGLFQLAALVNGGQTMAECNIYVTEPIDMSTYSNDNFPGIAWQYTTFQGTFNGQGQAISKLKIYYSNGATCYAGLFGHVMGEAVIENVVLDDTCIGVYAVKENLTILRSAGTIVGCLEGNAQVRNCYSATPLQVDVAVSHSNYGIGGIVGVSTSTTANVTNCTYAGKITNAYAGNVSHVGGIIGFQTGTLSGCKNTGTISLTRTDATHTVNAVGGVVGYGYAWGGTISNCENTGAITISGGTITNIGGVIGYSRSQTVNGCKNSATVKVSSGTYISGIVGGCNESGSTIKAINCINSGFIDTGYNGINVGGIVGIARNVLIQNCENSGRITANKQAGGMIAYPFWAGTITIENSVNRGNVEATWSNVGGLVAYPENGTATLTITDCANYGKISSSKGSTVGGFVARTIGAVTIKNSVNYGKISAAALASAIICDAAANTVTLANVRNYAEIISPTAAKNWYLGNGTGTLTADAYCADYYSTSTHFYGYQTRTNEKDSTKVDLRFVGSIDSAEYWRAGFKITVTNKTDPSKSFEIKEDVAHVYVELLQEGGNITVPAYRGEGAFLFALVVEGIPAGDLADYTFTVETYSIAAEGVAETQGDISTPNFSIVR